MVSRAFVTPQAIIWQAPPTASEVKYADVPTGKRMPADPPSVSTSESWRRPLLEDVLRGIRPQIGVAYWPEFRAPWSAGFKRDWAVFHIVAQGTCWLHLKAWKEPVPLSEGDFAVVRRAQCHTMRDSLSTPAVDFTDLFRTMAPSKKGALCCGGPGPAT